MSHEHIHKESIHEHEHSHHGIIHKHVHYHAPAKDSHKEDIAVSEEQHQHTHTFEFELYAYANSFIHNLDARTKIITLFIFILAMVLTPISETWRFLLFALVLAAMYLIARVPILFGLKKSAIVIPFVFFAGILLFFMPGKPHPSNYNLGFTQIPIKHGGLYILSNALIKSTLSVLTVVLLYSTTPFAKFLRGLEMFKVPKILISLFSFLYRFMWVITDETKRMLRARDARAFGGSRRWHLQVLGQMIGSLFIRSYERAERVYASMLSRGYDGTIKTIETETISWYDFLFATLFLAVLVAIIFWNI